jgi:hypothetical protein
MARSLNGAKWQAWRERFRRFESCDLTVADFCEVEGVSMPSFYEWRRKLQSLRQPAQRRRAHAPAERTFVPVQVVQARSTRAAVEIHLPNGARVHLISPDGPFMAAAIAAAGQLQRQPCEQEDGAC